ncbi:MAG: hypothetical protein JXA42_05005 [Anaerolineales bacterium]|nr:hypothetical protein [Anaerolineales bacterium]
MATDCALVTALPSELDRMLYHFRHAKKVVDNSRTGRVFFETISPSGLALVGATATGIGQLNAAALARDVVEIYSPKSVILVGISGGLDRKIPLGDVVISNQIVDYELAKVTPNGVETRWSVYQPDATLLNKAMSFRDSRWKQYIGIDRPASSPARDPDSHIGLYLSGNKVIADEDTAGRLVAFWHRAAAIEMEAAAIAAIFRQLQKPPGFIVIKGICDYADSKKNDSWQAYAADAAASFAYSFVTEQLSPQDLSWPHRQPTHDDSFSRALRITLQEAYDLSELRVLCYDLGVDWDEIAGSRKSEKIADLIQYMKRRRKLDKLIRMVNRDRSDVLEAFADV